MQVKIHARNFLLVMLIMTGLGSRSQDCTCSQINEQQVTKLETEDDSVTLYRLITNLKESRRDICTINAYNIDINFLGRHKHFAEMFEKIQQQEKLIHVSPCEKDLEIISLLNYADYYTAREDYEKLSAYSFKALENAENRNDLRNIVKAIKHIVYLFTRQDQDEKNWPYIKKAERIIFGLPEDINTASNYNWLAFEYENKYTLIERSSLLDSALMFAEVAKKSASPFNDHDQTIQSFRVFEAVSYHRGDLRKAIAYMDSALLYARKQPVPKNLASLYLSKAWDLIDLKEFDEAIRWQDTSIYYAEKFEHGSIASMRIYSEAVQVFEAAGNAPKALQAFKKYDHLKDSIFNLKRSEKINELEQRYEKSKNEKTIHELALQKRIYLLLALAGLLGLVVLAFLVRQQSLKNKQKILEAEQRLNRARMNPHFFFNALSSLQSTALKENDGITVAKNISRFAKIMRASLERSYKEYNSIEQETDFLKEYLELQQLRFPGKFNYEIKINGNIDPDEILIPSLILQPFIENSIEHGFSNINYTGHLLIDFSMESKQLLITISDNGKGLTNGPKDNNEHISRATQIIRDRLYLLNSKLKTRAAFTVANAEPGKGVMVKINLPVLYVKNIPKES